MVTSTQQFDLLVEYFRTANQRLSFRIRQRDLWLKTQLLLQIILILIVSIGNFQFADTVLAFNDLLILAFPMAALCCSLYSTQDRLISHIIAYLNDLAETATNYGNQIVPFKNLESSTAGKEYINTALPIRLIGQLFSFLIIPLWVAAFRIFSLDDFELIHMISAAVDLILAGLIVWLLSTSYSFRRK
ncbi:MAG: hypothetical protein HRU41_30295 [Saprospiraceae bacterium]|nr:hypothetical protein [Saprospiraceae bacterium]